MSFKSSFSRVQDFDAIRWISNLRAKFRGFMSAKKLQTFTGASLDEEATVTSKEVFTREQIVAFTQACLDDPDLIATKDMASAIMKSPSIRRHTVLPNMDAGSDEWVAMINDLWARLTAAVPPSKTDRGICDRRAVPTNWNRLFSRPGASMSPKGYPQCDNSGTGMAQAPVSERHRAIMQDVLNEMLLNGWDPQSGYEMSVKSGSGFPENAHAIERKLELFDKAAMGFATVISLFRNGELRKIARLYGIVFAYLISRRDQYDTVKIDEKGNRSVKDRPALSVGQAAGYEKGTIIANRLIDGLTGFFRTRSRIVYAGNGPLNYIFAALFTPLRDGYFAKFPFLFKHLSAANIAQKIRGWLVVGVDAKGFDTQYPTFFANMIFDTLEKVFEKGVVDMMRATWTMPAYCPSPVEGAHDQGAWFGHPFDLSTFVATRGLPSGISYNPDFGKMWGVAYILCMFDDIHHDVREFGVGRIMKGEHPAYATLNQGDDALLLVKSVEARQQLLELIESGRASPYIVLGIEDPVTFLGWVVSWNGLEYAVYPNIQSMVINFFANEHSIGDPRDKFGHRKHWGLGVESMKTVFGDCPEYQVVRDIMESVVKDHTGRSLSAWAEESAQISKQILGQTMLNFDEARLLDNPDRRYYSVDMENVRPIIASEVIRTISPERIRDILGPYVIKKAA